MNPSIGGESPQIPPPKPPIPPDPSLIVPNPTSCGIESLLDSRSIEDASSLEADGGVISGDGVLMGSRREAGSSLPDLSVGSGGPISGEYTRRETRSSRRNPNHRHSSPYGGGKDGGAIRGPMEVDNPLGAAAMPVPSGPIAPSQPHNPTVVPMDSSKVWSYAEKCKGSSNLDGLNLQYIPPIITPSGKRRVILTIDDLKLSAKAYALHLYGYFLGTSMDYNCPSPVEEASLAPLVEQPSVAAVSVVEGGSGLNKVIQPEKNSTLANLDDDGFTTVTRSKKSNAIKLQRKKKSVIVAGTSKPNPVNQKVSTQGSNILKQMESSGNSKKSGSGFDFAKAVQGVKPARKPLPNVSVQTKSGSAVSGLPNVSVQTKSGSAVSGQKPFVLQPAQSRSSMDVDQDPVSTGNRFSVLEGGAGVCLVGSECENWN
ncbi:hypothetical protein L1987_64519 [Smallanthus sonchifolius]|uniref:Uncharacterized protein n=1 Tax=Smallanthus sonchifolius TaxID=185202 RepID=A0ACB9BRY4_9ASTR|nr:hypothetical protein L1987_64519 [Smallanthus sonchifolius]